LESSPPGSFIESHYTPIPFKNSRIKVRLTGRRQKLAYSSFNGIKGKPDGLPSENFYLDVKFF
jgi:hypothetical protein